MNHQDDVMSIQRLHDEFTGRINDDALRFQDATYALGRKRGRQDAAALAAAAESLSAAMSASAVPGQLGAAHQALIAELAAFKGLQQ